MKLLLTGGMGFIGHHIVEAVLKGTDWDIIILDRLDFSGFPDRVLDIECVNQYRNRLQFVHWDLKAELNQFVSKEIGQVDYIWHLAASSHVDRSIEDPLSFVMDNVVGTTNILNFARTQTKLKQFINFSTDEVYGPAEVGQQHTEDSPHRPSNPYAASKAAQIDMGYSYFVTYGVPVVSTFTMNNFGERQTPEKLIPKCIRMVQQGKPMPIFAVFDKETKQMKAVGSSFWIHSREVASALLFLTKRGVPGEFYNIIGFEEYTNYEICQMVAEAVGKPLIPDFVDWHSSRPGHDARYALDGTKLKELGWSPQMSVKESLPKVVQWTVNHPNWL